MLTCQRVQSRKMHAFDLQGKTFQNETKFWIGRANRVAIFCFQNRFRMQLSWKNSIQKYFLNHMRDILSNELRFKN